MTPESFEVITKYVKERAGIVLSKDKQYLLDSRLDPVARRHRLESLDEIAGELRRNPRSRLGDDVVEAMTTNETFFFRDRTPFDHFTNVMLPHMLEARAKEKRLSIWSPAASTGQELYSLAMLLKEQAAKLATWRLTILGTDISNEALEKAKAGLYSQFEVQRGLAAPLLVKYFSQRGDLWQIDSSLKAMVQFRNFNLLQPFTSLGRFDIIFCRNVLIYFDQPTKKSILERLARLMPDDGFLVLGAAETVIGITDVFKPVPGKRGLFGLNRATGSTARPVPLRAAASATGGRMAAASAAGGAGTSLRPQAAGASRPVGGLATARPAAGLAGKRPAAVPSPAGGSKPFSRFSK